MKFQFQLNAEYINPVAHMWAPDAREKRITRKAAVDQFQPNLAQMCFGFYGIFLTAIS